MSKRAERYFREFYSLYQNILGDNSELHYEDSQLKAFTEILYESDFTESPFQIIRESGSFSTSKWSLLGFSTACISSIIDSDDDELDAVSSNDQVHREWNYVIYNGAFSKNNNISFKTITKNEIESTLKKTINFIKNTLNNNHSADFGPCRELQREIYHLKNTGYLGKFQIIYLTDHLINTTDLPNYFKIEELDITIGVTYVDIVKWGNIKNKSHVGSEVNIDLSGEEFGHYNLPYLKHSNPNNFQQYLSFFPGQFIADIYEFYSTSLLENNVRVFLSANNKPNKELRSTIRETPMKFFSFNNGISATASLVVTEDSKIIRLEDFQIVNGGQTTASLHYAWKKDKLSLSEVLVPVKITELKKDRNYGSMVARISRAANTQTAVKNSDFFANNPFLTKLDKLSQKVFTTIESNKIIYFYFERMSGQYNVSFNNSGRTEKFQKAWKKEHPSELMFTKIDVARWLNCQMGLPHIAAASAEKQFQLFIEEKNFKIPVLSINRYKYLVGYGILFKKIRQLIGTKNGRNYPSIISDSSVGMSTAIYTATMFHKLGTEKFNYAKIFLREINVIESLLLTERLETEIDFVLTKIVKEVWRLISEFGGTSVQEQSKRYECWQYVDKNFRLDDTNINNFFRIHQMNKIEFIQLDEVANNDNLNSYEEDLTFLFEGNFARLKALYSISNFDQEARKYKSQISNLIKRVREEDKVLKLDKVHEISQLIRILEAEGGLNLDLEFMNIEQLTIEFNFPSKSINGGLTAVRDFIEFAEASNPTSYESLLNEAHSIIDSFENNAGLSVNEIDEVLRFNFTIKKISK